MMNQPLKHSVSALLWLVCFLTIAFEAAAEVTGTVRDVSGSTATVTTKGGTPDVGDSVDIFFKLAGTEDEISVATGKVIGKEAGAVKVEIENATGDVTKDQLARFTATKGFGASPPEATPASQPVAPPPQPLATPEETDETPAPSPPRTRPSAEPFPSASPKSKPSPLPLQELENPLAAEYVRKGVAQASSGDLDGAIASYSAAIQNAPSLAVAYLNRANAYLYKSNYKAAIADANKALELKVAKTDDAYTIRGTAKAGLSDYDAAIADCNRALKINPKNALAYNNRANNKLRKGDYADALADCNKSISLDSSSALPYYNRGYVYVNQRNFAGALSDWKKAVRMQPSFATELNPKIAQLEAQGAAQTQPTQPRAPVYDPRSAEPQWTDLTNAPQKIVGTWQGGQHRIRFYANGTFVTDPHLVANPPKAQWQIQGDRLIQYYPQANMTTTMNIVSLSARELVVRDTQGNTFRLTKLK